MSAVLPAAPALSRLPLAEAFAHLLLSSHRTSRPMKHTVGSLFDGLQATLQGPARTAVTALCADSRRVRPGALFFAVPGSRTDGAYFIEEALGRGAVAVVAEKAFKPSRPVPVVVVPQVRAALAQVARRFHGAADAALDLVGITGTNGKSTVAFVLQHLLRTPEDPVGLLGTIQYDLGGRTLPAFRTTPEAIEVHALLAQMREAGCRRAVMEVSSHGLCQHRADGLEFAAACFLNLTGDHLDYHGSMEAYFAAKKKLFDGSLGKAAKHTVVNSDDPYGRKLADEVSAQGRAVLRFGTGPEAALRARDIVLGEKGSTFTVEQGGKTFSVESPLLGSYNVSNVLAAFALGLALGEELPVLVQRLQSFRGVPGRMERIEEGQPFNCLVDYAHTDDALHNALAMLRPVTPGRLLVVFGCGGNRDRTKRPRMTRAVLDRADRAFATADNPRGETVEAIFADMREAVRPGEAIVFEPDRRRAIELALGEARPGDCVLVAGKGHETFQEYADSVHPFDDRLVLRELLQAKGFPA